MSIQRIHKVPSDLPHACLYLDDLEEISKIMIEALVSSSTEVDEQSTVVYRVGDSKMDSIDDLQAYSGSAKDLEMHVRVGPYRELELHFNGIVEPYLRLYSLKDAEAWAVYAKIKSIFDRRGLKLKNSVATLPSWLKWALYALLVFVFPNLVWAFHMTRPLIWITAAYYAFLALVGYEVYFRPSRVFFVRSHERSKESSIVRRRNVRDIAFLSVGAVLAVIIWLVEQAIANYYKLPPRQ